MKSNIRDNKGQTLIIVMLVAIVLLIVVISLTSKAILNTSQNSITYSGEKAFTAAQTGIQNALNTLDQQEFSLQTAPTQPQNITKSTGSCSSSTQKCNYIISAKTTPTNSIKQGATLPVNLQGSVIQTTQNVTTQTYTGNTNSWQNTQSLPNNITSAGVTEADGNAYVLGGYTNGINNSTYKGSLSNIGVSGWNNQPALPQPTEQNAAVSNGQYIYSIGGQSQYTVSNYICSWNPYTYTYYSPYYVWYYTYYWYWGGHYWEYGGHWTYYIIYEPHTGTHWYYQCQYRPYTYTEYTSNVYYSNLNNGNIGSWSITLSSLPQAIYDTTAVEYNNYIYLFGGRNSSGTPLNTVYRSQIQGNGELSGWTKLNVTLPDGNLYGMAGTEYNGTIYLAGGYNGSNATNTLLQYNPPNDNSGSGTFSTTASTLPVSIYNEGISIIPTTSTNANGTSSNVTYIYLYGGITTKSILQTTSRFTCGWHYNPPYAPRYYCGYTPTTNYITTKNISNTTYYATLNSSSWNMTSNMLTTTQRMGYVTNNSIMYSIGGSNTTSQNAISEVEYTSPQVTIQHTTQTSTQVNENSLLINTGNQGSFEVQLVYGTQGSETVKSCIENNASSGNYVIPIQPLANATVAYITPLSNTMTITAYPTSQIPTNSSNITANPTNCTP